MFSLLGKTDIKISSVIMGCSQAGGTPLWQNIDETTAVASITKACELGINTFDTAPMYGEGQSERVLGKALEGIRSQTVIATKISPHNMNYSNVISSCEDSLRNLKTDYIDLLQLHFPSGALGSEIVAISETLDAMNQLRKEGKIRAIGVSNFSLEQLTEASNYAEISSVQPPYSLFWRHLGERLTPFCVENKISILGYAPLAQGLLTGRYTKDKLLPSDEFRSKQILCSAQHYPRVQEALEQLKPIADKNQLTLSQLAILWLISQPNTSAIVGARTVSQVIDNAAILNLTILVDDKEKIDDIGEIVAGGLSGESLIWEF
jgi:myo-inositol catabolism protein IolS